MIKKYILCILAVLITITNSSYAFPADSKPMSKRATLVPTSVTFKISSEVGTSNTTKISVDDVNNLNAVGKLDIVKNDGSNDCCTASVIRTDNGNIAITAAHCLFDFNTQTWNSEVYFYPGYNHGQQGNIGKVAAKSGYIYDIFKDNPALSDYAFIKLDYPEGRKLQDDTGAFDYDLDIPGDIYPVNVFGYPVDGDMNCPKDGQNLCDYEGLSYDMPNEVPIKSYRGITIDVGHCSSGGPWVRIYDPNTNSGNVMGVSQGILDLPYPDETVAWSWTRDEFTQILNFAETN
ncbi:6667_t:CDS:1 [Funneliformis geosporum]|uniref:18779_t:CDS:1 n=1 Tax=Funneliformis geosporum TaxID=1117311 RepID=A0A9W4WUZ9_9GLOM|nr:18779_t:CDS:1 [Funneliformis geosporum]CAI2186575.1 6667_t:CDS:1 [Funneliformis geosporum]